LIVLPRSLVPRFLSLVEYRIKALRPGKDVSSLISQQPIARLESLLSKAESEGARILHGGKRFAHPDRPHGAYFEPTLVVDVKMDMDIAKEELFAPVMSVVAYDTVDEAIGWLNASRFGLGASVFGNNKKECQNVAGRLQCGMVSINE
jgi:acyl-CoA reductase-like NAD-dependent aldehyde dehydrogenase